jgi:hypothetical protein
MLRTAAPFHVFKIYAPGQKNREYARLLLTGLIFEATDRYDHYAVAALICEVSDTH